MGTVCNSKSGLQRHGRQVAHGSSTALFIRSMTEINRYGTRPRGATGSSRRVRPISIRPITRVGIRRACTDNLLASRSASRTLDRPSDVASSEQSAGWDDRICHSLEQHLAGAMPLVRNSRQRSKPATSHRRYSRVNPGWTKPSTSPSGVGICVHLHYIAVSACHAAIAARFGWNSPPGQVQRP